jgi:hypothetical protein
MAYDIGDRDPGEFDSTEVDIRQLDKWHPSHLPAQLPAADFSPTESGRKYLKDLLDKTAPVAKKTHSKPSGLTSCWKDTPEPFRKLVARAAGLDASVVAKADRDLTEAEKAAIRGAAKRLKERADALFAL